MIYESMGCRMSKFEQIRHALTIDEMSNVGHSTKNPQAGIPFHFVTFCKRTNTARLRESQSSALLLPRRESLDIFGPRRI